MSSRIFGIRQSAALAAAAVVTIAVSMAWLVAQPPERPAPDRNTFALFPRTLGEWSGVQARLDPDIEATLDAKDYIDATYVARGTRTPVNFFSAYYEDQTESSGIHSPEVCLPAGGWEIFSFETKEVTFANTVFGTFNLNRAIIQKGLQKQMVYYWFEQRGERQTNDFAAKMSVARDVLLTGRSDGALVRFVTPMDPNESEAEAEDRILTLMSEILPRLPRFLPQ